MDDPGPSTSFRAQFASLPHTGPVFQESDFETEESIQEEYVWEDGMGEEGGEIRREVERGEGEWEGLYAILNLPTTSTPTQIRDRYKALAMVYHPDKRSEPLNSGSSTNKSPLKAETDGHGNNSTSTPSPSTNPPSTAASTAQFTRIQTASSILLDPHKRAVYDHFGLPGLHEKWEVAIKLSSIRAGFGPESYGTKTTTTTTGNKFDSPHSLATYYQSQSLLSKRSRIESLIRSKTDSNLTIDARAVFLPESFFAEEVRGKVDHSLGGRVGRVRVGQMGFRSSFEVPISKQTQFIYAGQMMARNGAGGGNVVGTVRHQFSPKVWVEAGSSILAPRIATLKATYAHDQDTFATVNAVQVTPKAPPAVSVTVGRKVMKGVTGFSTLRSGFWELGPWGKGIAATMGRTDKPGLSIGLTTVGHAGSGFTLEGSTGLGGPLLAFGADQHASIDYSRKVLDGFKLKIGTSVGNGSGLSGFANVERQVSESTRLGMGLTVAYPGGMTFRIRFWRLGQKVVIPILLSQTLNPTVLLFSTVLPAASMIAAHHLYIKPRKRRRVQNRLVELQKEHADYLAQKKAEAGDAVALMEEHVQKKVEQERANDGLIIILAHYGSKACFTPSGRRQLDGQEEKVADVTIPVQALVNNGSLHIPGSRPKANLLGFYDPCMGEPKTLHVEYIFKGKMHSCSVDDMATLRAPVRAHAVEDARNGSWEI